MATNVRRKILQPADREFPEEGRRQTANRMGSEFARRALTLLNSYGPRTRPWVASALEWARDKGQIGRVIRKLEEHLSALESLHPNRHPEAQADTALNATLEMLTDLHEELGASTK